MNTESEIAELRRRVDQLEATVATISGTVSSLEPRMQSNREIANNRFDSLDSALARLTDRIARVDTYVWSLRDDLPSIVQESVKKAMEK